MTYGMGGAEGRVKDHQGGTNFQLGGQTGMHTWNDTSTQESGFDQITNPGYRHYTLWLIIYKANGDTDWLVGWFGFQHGVTTLQNHFLLNFI